MGAEPVIVLYASISVLNWMRAATGYDKGFSACEGFNKIQARSLNGVSISIYQ